MAIVIVGIIGGAVVGVVGAASYSDHSDHADYNDAAEKQRAKEEAKRREAAARREQEEIARREALQDLDYSIGRNVRSFRVNTGIEPKTVVTASQCQFREFDDDMRPMNSSVESSIRAELGRDKKDQVQKAQQKLELIDQAITAINDKIPK